MYRIDTQHCNHDLTDEEQSACMNVVEKSQHVSIQLLPNHHINEENELQGFVISCIENENASVIPFPKNMFHMTALYEVLPFTASPPEITNAEFTNNDDIDYDKLFENAQNQVNKIETTFDFEAMTQKYHHMQHHHSQRHEIANPDFIRIINDSTKYKKLFTDWLKDMYENRDKEPLFDCIPTDVDTEVIGFEESVSEHDDRRAWTESLPCKVGLYHTHMPSQTHDHSRHRLFIVVSGACRRAGEQLHNLWADFRSQITCRDLLESEEMQWLKETTIRNHGRIAAKLAEILDLHVKCMPDLKDPMQNMMCLPESFSYLHDCKLMNHRVHVSNNATFVEDADNGIIVDIFANEGFWVFNGPPDPAGNNLFGGLFDYKNSACLPTSTIRYHQNYTASRHDRTATVDAAQFPINICYGLSALLTNNPSASVFENQVPDDKFIQTMSHLSFERDHGCVHLMPILTFCET